MRVGTSSGMAQPESVAVSAEASSKETRSRRRPYVLLCLGIAVVALIATVAIMRFRRYTVKASPLDSASDEDTEKDDAAVVPASGNSRRRRAGPLAHRSLLLREDSLGLLVRRTLARNGNYAQRLPRSVVPIHYDLEIAPSFTEDRKEAGRDDSFYGHVAILIRCVIETSDIVLHASHLNLTRGDADEPEVEVVSYAGSRLPNHPLGSLPPELLHISKSSGERIPVSGFHFEQGSDFLFIRLTQQLRRGKLYTVKINFSGLLGDTRGFYKYHYDWDGKLQHLIVTFFEPTFAREAFPCFDEPDLKATFNVVVLRPPGYHAISTMPLVQSQNRPDKGLVADYFGTTPKMSTYTLAFVISNYTTIRDRQVTIWTHPGDAPYASYALDVTPKILRFFESLFKSPYALPKLDLVALPSFMVDAMENWGLLTFHKQSLLFDSSRATPVNLLTTASVIAHELAHQWFGNLVTMRWWNDIWLNEGFAAYMQYLGVNAVHPEWNIMEKFTVTEMHPIMKTEYLNDGHSVSVTGNISTELDALFDRIVYNKGPCLVRMMSYFMTPKVFLRGIQSYLTKYSIGNTAQDDLFEELTKANKAHGGDQVLDVKEVMDTWTKQAGYPVVHVVRNYKEGTATLTQMHYSKSPVQDRLWHIGVTYTDSRRLNFSNTRPVVWMKQREVHLVDLPKGNGDWVILNLQSAGYYKVNYDILNWELLRKQLISNPQAIAVLNRAQLLQDASDLAESGSLGYDVALGVLDYIGKERSYAPLKTAMSTVEELDGRMRSTDFYSKWQLYMGSQLEVHYERLTQEAPAHSAPHKDLLRKDVVFWSCQFGYRQCLERCVRTFRSFLNNSLSLKGALEHDLTDTLVVLCHAIRVGDSTDWRFLLDHVRDARTPEEAHVILNALGCSRDARNLRSLLLSTVMNESSNLLKATGTESLGLIFESVSFSTTGSQLALQFLVQNWKPLYERYGQASAFRDTIWYALQSIRKSEDLDKMTAFYTENVQTTKNAKRLARTFKSALDAARSNLRWVTTYGRTIERWLDRQIREKSLTASAAQIMLS